MLDNTFLNNSQANLNYNVRIIQRDKETGRIINKVEGKNILTKLPLMGIVRLFNGDLTNSKVLDINNYIPKYIAAGINGVNQDSNLYIIDRSSSVSTYVSTGDSSLYQEICDKDNKQERIRVTQSNIENSNKTDYVKLVLKFYIPSTSYNGLIDNNTGKYSGSYIKEVGLFTDSTGNNCWARYVLPGNNLIYKNSNSIIDVTWEITIKSSGTAIYPSSIDCLSETDSYNYNILFDNDSIISTFPMTIDLYSTVSILPENSNMNSIYFTVYGRDESVYTANDIVSLNNRGILTIDESKRENLVTYFSTRDNYELVVVASTVNNLQTTFSINIRKKDINNE